MKTNQPTEVDIAIIGGGVAGCTAAIALSDCYKVAVIDKLVEPIDRIGECLAPAARRILKRLNLIEEFENKITTSEKKIQQRNNGIQSYWGSEKVQITDSLRNPDGFGWQLNRKEFEIYLRESTQQRIIDCFWGYKLHHCQYENLHWILNFTTNNTPSETLTIKAKFVIDASGRQSHFARKLGIEREVIDKLISCWATLTNEEISKLSTISADELGWWYSAPLPNNKRVLALQTDSDLMERANLKSKDAFLQLALANPQMESIISKNKHNIQFNGTVSANSTKLFQVAGQQWAALGDAAISFDPLSSQGMFNAMASALQLTDLLQEFEIINELNLKKQQQFQTTYTNQINQIWEHYLKHKRIFYSQELRWKDSEFWKRRI
ncbi:tryptophan 7-halogenase [Flavobacterium sp.]|uniref:NAD(P)/FAD-dependent oxidoreductase n=1 Tax=Flavobacterium sp. TaxID=239 RepID=UPI00260AAD03|nr:tryptophan 7-halogenase [Flavobacterium sp.]